MDTQRVHRFTQTTRLSVAIMALALILAACTSTAASPSPSSSAGTSCAKADLALKTAGTLTLSTDNPAYSPWFQGGNKGSELFDGDYGNDPYKGKGFEGALAYAIAGQLGFAKGEVTWVVTTFDQSFAPGMKAFDLFMNQVSITSTRAEAVDFSAGYYDVYQAVLTVEGSAAANAASIADLKELQFGAQIGTTSYQAIIDDIAPTKDVMTYNTNDDAVAALKSGQIDAMVTDVPTAVYMRGAQLSKKGLIVGQLPTPGQFGVVLEKGSALTACVNEAIAALKADGTIDALLMKWLGTDYTVPELN
ncbi:MAG: hypothetical protein RIT06_501 [Chloroflexota bacterium]|jgi:polar amino acid transport system substrate-binding protein